MSLKISLRKLYEKLLDLYGYQNWWPIDEEYHKNMGTDPRDEVIISAVLTQNTSWKNVERALERIKREGILSLEFVRSVDEKTLQDLIRPAGFYTLKSKRLKELALFMNPTEKVKYVSRGDLLKIKGIGRETADVILLYAGGRLYFVIDKYTQRFMERFYGLKGSYESLKNFFEENLPKDVKVYKEFHALMDEHAKRFCKSIPLCGGCPLKDMCINASPSS
ncbi:MAG: endonuclease III domain-containing protein [Hydrogenobacter thermophilus]|uniref:endonuclease III domain-containing protein n=1 Tax=Hydrogenobacter thermophilus TaxID=940 RepID=UPI001C73EE16|nr:endonuclease III domain-containing protein [Hydrogenobacter thermophilus]QWK20655.1 MAG: endonuclease III domain-containing protein [Hydrogenobacter thermophilus]